MQIEKETLEKVVCKIINKEVINVEFQTELLQGGTVGDVRLVYGNAETKTGVQYPYKVVCKTQKKWERYGDAGSWRREYDLYSSRLSEYFTDSLCWPVCYLTQMNQTEDEYQLWMEYIEGESGLDLTLEMNEKAAFELGSFQGKVWREAPACLKDIKNLSNEDFLEQFYFHYRSWNVVYDYIRSDSCKLPKEFIRRMLQLDENSDEIVNRLKKLPLVLCHRDFWVTNIFYNDEKIALIDWDTAGFGHFGEDIASLIADDSKISLMVELFKKCIPAYCKGFQRYAELTEPMEQNIYDMILMNFGYRLVEGYLEAEGDEDSEEARKEKNEIVERMLQICEMY